MPPRRGPARDAGPPAEPPAAARYAPKHTRATSAQIATFERINDIHYVESDEGARCGMLGCGRVHSSVGVKSGNGRQSCEVDVDGETIPVCVSCAAFYNDPAVKAAVEAAEAKYAALWASGPF